MALEAKRNRAHPAPMIPLHLPLLQDFYKHFASQNLQQRQSRRQPTVTKGRQLRLSQAPDRHAVVPSDGQDARQPTLVLTPSVELTRRYYTNNKSGSRDRQQLRRLVDGLETQACSRCPFSQVVYSNLEPAASVADVPEGLSYLPRPGGLTLSSRSPTFVHQHKVRLSRSSLERALTSDNSQDAVVQRAISHLRHAIVMPIASDRSKHT